MGLQRGRSMEKGEFGAIMVETHSKSNKKSNSPDGTCISRHLFDKNYKTQSQGKDLKGTRNKGRSYINDQN